MSLGTPTKAEYVPLGGSPIWVFALFIVNELPVVVANFWLGLEIAPGVLLGFAIYFMITEEFHWRIHLGEKLPVGFRRATAHHLAHHMRPNGRLNIFLPLWDKFLGSIRD